jgi:hypothetical protein
MLCWMRPKNKTGKGRCVEPAASRLQLSAFTRAAAKQTATIDATLCCPAIATLCMTHPSSQRREAPPPAHREEHLGNVGVVLAHDALGSRLDRLALHPALAQLRNGGQGR